MNASTGDVAPDLPGTTVRRWIHVTILAWVFMLGTDLLVHAVALSRFYASPSPFLLDAGRAFRLIPLGYASFLILAALLTGLAGRLQIAGWRTGAGMGLVLGASIWGSLALGLASITTAPWALLAGWFVGQTVELGVAGAMVGAAAAGTRMRHLWLLAGAWLVLAIATTAVAQSLGWVPAVSR